MTNDRHRLVDYVLIVTMLCGVAATASGQGASTETERTSPAEAGVPAAILGAPARSGIPEAETEAEEAGAAEEAETAEQGQEVDIAGARAPHRRAGRGDRTAAQRRGRAPRCRRSRGGSASPRRLPRPTPSTRACPSPGTARRCSRTTRTAAARRRSSTICAPSSNAGYRFNDRFLFNSEIEVEHAKEIFVEFAYVDFQATESFGLRGGMLLVPMGLVNEFHEPTVFMGAERPVTENRIIPSSWRENGRRLLRRLRADLVPGLRPQRLQRVGLLVGRAARRPSEGRQGQVDEHRLHRAARHHAHAGRLLRGQLLQRRFGPGRDRRRRQRGTASRHQHLRPARSGPGAGVRPAGARGPRHPLRRGDAQHGARQERQQRRGLGAGRPVRPDRLRPVVPGSGGRRGGV